MWPRFKILSFLLFPLAIAGCSASINQSTSAPSVSPASPAAKASTLYRISRVQMCAPKGAIFDQTDANGCIGLQPDLFLWSTNGGKFEGRLTPDNPNLKPTGNLPYLTYWLEIKSEGCYPQMTEPKTRQFYGVKAVYAVKPAALSQLKFSFETQPVPSTDVEKLVSVVNQHPVQLPGGDTAVCPAKGS